MELSERTGEASPLESGTGVSRSMVSRLFGSLLAGGGLAPVGRAILLLRRSAR